MKLILTTCVCLLICAIYSYSQSTTSIAKIDSIRLKMQDLARTNSLVEVSGFYAENAVVNGFDTQLSGIEEIMSYWKNIQGRAIDWEWEDLEYSGSNEYIAQSGISKLTLGYGEREITYSSLFSVVWEMQSDSSYKIVSDFYRRYERPEFQKFKKDSVWIITKSDTIFGVLYLPDKKPLQKVPAVLCLQGGGDVGLSNYFYEPEFFAAKGMAALICDKSGSGLSKGKSSWVTQTFEEKTQEYSTLLHWLKNHTSVNQDQVGIHGMSEGGRLALNLAIKYPDEISFVNTVSAPIESFKQNQLFAIHNLLMNRGFNYSTTIEVLQIWDNYFDKIASGKISKDIITKAENLRDKTPGLYLPPNSLELPQRPRPEDIHFSIEKGIETIDCPVLYQYAENDALVNTTKCAAFIPEKSTNTVLIYENADHSITDSNGRTLTEYLEDKSLWLDQVLE